MHAREHRKDRVATAALRFATRGEKYGASEGIRTLDVHLGKVMLYWSRATLASKLELKKYAKIGDELQVLFFWDFGRTARRFRQGWPQKERKERREYKVPG